MDALQQSQGVIGAIGFILSGILTIFFVVDRFFSTKDKKSAEISVLDERTITALKGRIDVLELEKNANTIEIATLKESLAKLQIKYDLLVSEGISSVYSKKLEKKIEVVQKNIERMLKIIENRK